MRPPGQKATSVRSLLPTLELRHSSPSIESSPDCARAGIPSQIPSQAEANLAALIESTEDLVWSVDADDRLITFNSALRLEIEAFFGRQVAAGKRLEEAFPPERAALWPPLYERARAEGTFNAEYSLFDGQALELTFNPFVIDGKIAGVSVIGKDISERKRNEKMLRESAEERLAATNEALRVSELRYRTVFQTSLDCVSISHLDGGRFVDVNQAFLDTFGLDRGEVIGHTALEIPLWEYPRDRQNIARVLRQNEHCENLEVRFRKKNGEIFPGLVSAALIVLDGVCCVLSFMRDISDARKAEERLSQIQEALRNSEERHRIAFQASPNAVSIFRLDDGMYIDVNITFLETMGFGRQEVVGRSSPDLNIWADPGDWQNLEETLRESGVFRGEVQFRKKNGEIYWGLMSASVFDHDGVSCVLSVTQDVSAAKAAQQEIRNLAFYDPLTTLPNRRLLEERLGQALAASALNHRNQALLFVDLDDFKTLNDTLGHQTGDLLLLEVAGRLSACVRESDTVARLGGDEFVVMLEELSEIPEDAAAQAEAIGKKILAAVGQPYRLDDHQCRSSASIGITVFGGQQKTAGEVLQHADIAMYQAKAAGRNTIRFFAPALQAAVHARAELEEELRDAIMANQFVLYYQPQVDRARLIGAEALIRWNHPRRGLLAPGEFISLAEETGLILPMGDWVLETACRQIAAWAQRKVAANISVAVNISARQFRQPGFVDQTLAIIGRTGANPGNLKLELTESMLVENVEDVIAKMVTLRSCGLRFSLDDFGTGYSSLAYLKRLPLDQLKIDRSFVRDILEDTGSCAIAQSVISLGKALGLTVVAEGVETVEQRDHLDRLGCHKHQGFLFGRPVSLEEFERTWLGCGACPAPGPGKRRRVAGNKLR